MKTIRADVLNDWDREQNPGCLFIPGDLVQLMSRVHFHSDLANRYEKQVGKIIAVSSGSPGKIRGTHRRQFTRYYMRMMDGEILGLHSHFLKLWENKA